MNLLPKNEYGCPYLILAPMEGVGDHYFRKAIASIGGFDEGVRDFLRVPSNAHVKSLAVRYQYDEIKPIPIAAQIMGSDPQLMADMAYELEKLGAPRIDLNCGCPSNTVTGRGAGSSLLKNPEYLYEIAKAMCDAVSVPVTAKLRSGFNDQSLFKENLLAAEESGIKYLTLHPRTKADGYGPPAKWELIAEAKSILKIPIVGNGDILNVEDALRMLEMTKCDALMIGRGAVINPFIFHQIKGYYSGKKYIGQWEEILNYFSIFVSSLKMPERKKISKIKQLMSFLFKSNQNLLEKRDLILRAGHDKVDEFLNFALPQLERDWLLPTF